jgi:hypothetical protein
MKRFFVASYASALTFILCTAFYSLCQSIKSLLCGNIIGLVWLISAVFFEMLGWEMTDIEGV